MNLLREIKTKLKWAFTHCPSLSERKLHEVVTYPVQDHAYIAAYWKDQSNGKGPAVSLYVCNKEVMKFDCFGEGKGHYHININQPPLVPRGEERIQLMERTREEQVKRAIFEIQKNASYFLQRNFDPRVTFFKLDKSKLETACGQAQAKLLEYAAKF
ncbi:MAG: hypothetical protein A3C35_04205 [Omnitrophica bacterium RIFCSPHIGHO2_02_FULL_46_11]|nr:MAG: hypothetical protein A3A81_07095 [Omnitrophica bacterium RIFCSPLOWO2_01_FULL_45_10b]OGW86909.1 MAG: hypothetical protein A3C35_04205 [Omnitrophica bacterium RIFCSPHIGHO2_02_FULL_46_11]